MLKCPHILEWRSYVYMTLLHWAECAFVQTKPSLLGQRAHWSICSAIRQQQLEPLTILASMVFVGEEAINKAFEPVTTQCILWKLCPFGPIRERNSVCWNILVWWVLPSCLVLKPWLQFYFTEWRQRSRGVYLVWGILERWGKVYFFLRWWEKSPVISYEPILMVSRNDVSKKLMQKFFSKPENVTILLWLASSCVSPPVQW